MADEAPWSRWKSEIYALIGRNPRSNRRIVNVAELHADHDVLDIGCGAGAAVRAAAPLVARAVGVDRSEAMIDIASRRSQSISNAEFVVAGAEKLPFADQSFDRVWTIHAFHHWADPVVGLGESRRVLKPGGRLLIVESETKGPHGLSTSSANELAARLQSLGFDDASVSKPMRQIVVTGFVS